MAFGQKTVSRLVSVLEGFITASTVVLILSGLLMGGTAIRGATLGFMGLALGILVGVPLGRRLGSRVQQPSDRRLPLLLALLFLPLAILPVHHGVAGLPRFGFLGWSSVLAAVAVALPLGAATGTSWFFLESEPSLEPGARLKWTGAGVVLGMLVGTGAALALSSFRGSFLVILFAAPLVWPILPQAGPRTLLVRMLLTLLVLLSAMSLLFL